RTRGCGGRGVCASDDLARTRVRRDGAVLALLPGPAPRARESRDRVCFENASAFAWFEAQPYSAVFGRRQSLATRLELLDPLAREVGDLTQFVLGMPLAVCEKIEYASVR